MNFDIDNLSQMPWAECHECGGTIFRERTMFKRISRFVSPTGKDEVIPVSVAICSACNTVPDFIMSKLPGQAITNIKDGGGA
jgi:hypothetical protein